MDQANDLNLPVWRHLDVRESGEREGRPTLTAKSVKSGCAGAVGPVVRLAHQPRRARAPVEAGHALAAYERDGAVLAAEAGMTLALVVRDAIWIEKHLTLTIEIIVLFTSLLFTFYFKLQAGGSQ